MITFCGLQIRRAICDGLDPGRINKGLVPRLCPGAHGGLREELPGKLPWAYLSRYTGCPRNRSLLAARGIWTKRGHTSGNKLPWQEAHAAYGTPGCERMRDGAGLGAPHRCGFH